MEDLSQMEPKYTWLLIQSRLGSVFLYRAEKLQSKITTGALGRGALYWRSLIRASCRRVCVITDKCEHPENRGRSDVAPAGG